MYKRSSFEVKLWARLSVSWIVFHNSLKGREVSLPMLLSEHLFTLWYATLRWNLVKSCTRFTQLEEGNRITTQSANCCKFLSTKLPLRIIMGFRKPYVRRRRPDMFARWAPIGPLDYLLIPNPNQKRKKGYIWNIFISLPDRVMHLYFYQLPCV